MTIVAKDEQIVRAWLLVNAETDKLAKLAAAIRKTVNTAEEIQGSEKTFIKRADVTLGPFNLIMPVYAETDALMRKVIGIVRSYPGVTQVLEARVSEHVPVLPQDAPGDFAEAGAPEKLRGENAWG